MDNLFKDILEYLSERKLTVQKKWKQRVKEGRKRFRKGVQS